MPRKSDPLILSLHSLHPLRVRGEFKPASCPKPWFRDNSSMRRTLLVSILLIGVASGLAAIAQDAPTAPAPPPSSAPSETRPSSQPSTSPTTSPAKSTKGQRVVLLVNRNLEVAGHIELEDDDVIVVRDLEGKNQSFAKARVGQIVRLVQPEPGQRGVVVMRDGQTREGVIVEDDFDHVLIEIEGIRANLKRSTVSHVMLSPTVEQLYEQYKATLQPGHYDAHFRLCQWLADEKRYDLAHKELLLLLEQVEMADALQLFNIVDAQMKLRGKPVEGDAGQPGDEHLGDAPQNGAADGDGSLAGSVRAVDLMPEQLVTKEDVNLIRVYEIDFEHQTRVTITPDTVRTLIEKYGTNDLVPASQTGRNQMFRTAADDPLQIVRLMFELRARDLYPLIQVNSEPYALNLFRRRVHDTWLINTCATNACHGSPFAGRFFLHRKNYKDDEVRFTNLLILETLQLDPNWPLINYERPEDSLIIQYALPRELARKPHPLVSGFKPAISPTNQRMKQDAIEWIEAMMQPRPEIEGRPYGVEYQPPRVGGEAPRPDPDQPPGKVPR
jgi:hypothetical protein